MGCASLKTGFGSVSQSASHHARWYHAEATHEVADQHGGLGLVYQMLFDIGDDNSGEKLLAGLP